LTDLLTYCEESRPRLQLLYYTSPKCSVSGAKQKEEKDNGNPPGPSPTVFFFPLEWSISRSRKYKKSAKIDLRSPPNKWLFSGCIALFCLLTERIGTLKKRKHNTSKRKQHVVRCYICQDSGILCSAKVKIWTSGSVILPVNTIPAGSRQNFFFFRFGCSSRDLSNKKKKVLQSLVCFSTRRGWSGVARCHFVLHNEDLNSIVRNGSYTSSARGVESWHVRQIGPDFRIVRFEARLICTRWEWWLFIVRFSVSTSSYTYD
jgi:hypothetical protein